MDREKKHRNYTENRLPDNIYRVSDPTEDKPSESKLSERTHSQMAIMKVDVESSGPKRCRLKLTTKQRSGEAQANTCYS